MHPIQALVNQMNAEAQQERSGTQLTLGGLIERLEAMPQDAKVIGFGEPHSYRGYYCDLAFEKTAEKRTVAEVLYEVRGCMGQKFEGYKGGDFWMTGNTPVWLADYGRCGLKIMAIADDGTLSTVEDA